MQILLVGVDLYNTHEEYIIRNNVYEFIRTQTRKGIIKQNNTCIQMESIKKSIYIRLSNAKYKFVNCFLKLFSTL